MAIFFWFSLAQSTWDDAIVEKLFTQFQNWAVQKRITCRNFNAAMTSLWNGVRLKLVNDTNNTRLNNIKASFVEKARTYMNEKLNCSSTSDNWTINTMGTKTSNKRVPLMIKSLALTWWVPTASMINPIIEFTTLKCINDVALAQFTLKAGSQPLVITKLLFNNSIPQYQLLNIIYVWSLYELTSTGSIFLYQFFPSQIANTKNYLIADNLSINIPANQQKSYGIKANIRCDTWAENSTVKLRFMDVSSMTPVQYINSTVPGSVKIIPKGKVEVLSNNTSAAPFLVTSTINLDNVWSFIIKIKKEGGVKLTDLYLQNIWGWDLTNTVQSAKLYISNLDGTLYTFLADANIVPKWNEYSAIAFTNMDYYIANLAQKKLSVKLIFKNLTNRWDDNKNVQLAITNTDSSPYYPITPTPWTSHWIRFLGNQSLDQIETILPSNTTIWGKHLFVWSYPTFEKNNINLNATVLWSFSVTNQWPRAMRLRAINLNITNIPQNTQIAIYDNNWNPVQSRQGTPVPAYSQIRSLSLQDPTYWNCWPWDGIEIQNGETKTYTIKTSWTPPNLTNPNLPRNFKVIWAWYCDFFTNESPVNLSTNTVIPNPNRIAFSNTRLPTEVQSRHP